MEKDKLEQLWLDERHWRWNCVYICQEDPRLLVPKKRRWAGWTFNYAHRLAMPLTILVLVPIIFIVVRAIYLKL